MEKTILVNPVKNPKTAMNPAGKHRGIIPSGVNDKGIALVIALMMLLVLTLIGINAITSTTHEAGISGNERVGTGAFYAAEAGIQVGLNQLNRFPSNLIPVSRTKLGEDSYFWSGSPKDKNFPRAMDYLGLHAMPGYDVNWSFKRYQFNATGESFGATREIEVQIANGPFAAGTNY